jgi:hypothetical protein
MHACAFTCVNSNVMNNVFCVVDETEEINVSDMASERDSPLPLDSSISAAPNRYEPSYVEGDR